MASGSFLFAGHCFGNLAVPTDDFFIVLPSVGVQAAAAILAPIRTNYEAAATFGAQQVERTITKQTVKIIRIRPWVAGKIFTFPVGEIGILLF